METIDAPIGHSASEIAGAVGVVSKNDVHISKFDDSNPRRSPALHPIVTLSLSVSFGVARSSSSSGYLSCGGVGLMMPPPPLVRCAATSAEEASDQTRRITSPRNRSVGCTYPSHGPPAKRILSVGK